MSSERFASEKVWRLALAMGNGVAICNNGAHRDRYSIGTVSRVTATQLIVANQVGYERRFNRETGREVGSGRSSIEPITKRIRADIKEHEDRREFGNLCYRPDNLPADEIAVMLDALNAYRAAKEANQDGN